MKLPKINIEIQNKLKELETERLINKKKGKNFIKIAMAIIVVEYILFVIFHFSFYIVFGSAIVLAIIYFILSQTKIKSRFKEEVLTPLINANENMTYNALSSISKEEFKASELFSTSIDKFSGEDLFYGKKGETVYKFSELKVEEKHTSIDSKGKPKTTYSTIFQGVFMIADFNKKLKYYTKVIESNGDFFSKIFFNKTKVE